MHTATVDQAPTPSRLRRLHAARARSLSIQRLGWPFVAGASL